MAIKKRWPLWESTCKGVIRHLFRGKRGSNIFIYCGVYKRLLWQLEYTLVAIAGEVAVVERSKKERM